MEITFPQALILLFSIFLLICTLLFFFNDPTNSKPKTQFGFKHYPILGTLPEFFLNRHRFLDWSTDVLSHCPTNTAVFSRPGKLNGVITASPANVEHMLKTNFDNYPKGTRFISLLDDFLGRGIFNSDGEAWRTQRKTASYEFNTRSLRNFVVCRPENQFKFPVFHGGPRICLGKELAYTQMKLVAATIIEIFQVEVVATAELKNPPEHVLSLTMRMKNGLRIRLTKR